MIAHIETLPMTSPIHPLPFNLADLRAAWQQPRPDTWTHGGPDEGWRTQGDMARALAQGNVARADRLLADDNGATLARPMRIRNNSTTLQPGMSWLAQAVCWNNVPMMDMLLARGASLTEPTQWLPKRSDDASVRPLLYLALQHDALDAAQWLLDHGAGWEGVDSSALFELDKLATRQPSERCMIAWLSTWNRPWADPEDALRWAQLALMEDDPALLRCVLQRTPANYWAPAQLETLWITAIQFDRDEGVHELLNAGVVPPSDVAEHRSFNLGDQHQQHDLRAPTPQDPDHPTPWWQRNDEVPTPWAWLVVRAGARRIGERWLTVPAELERMRQTLAQEPLVWLQRPTKNTVRQPMPALRALADRIDLGQVRDAEGNTPLHRWVGLAMESEELMRWAAQRFPEWGQAVNQHGQTVWEFASDLRRPVPMTGVTFEARLHKARGLWDSTILNQAVEDAPPMDALPARSRL